MYPLPRLLVTPQRAPGPRSTPIPTDWVRVPELSFHSELVCYLNYMSWEGVYHGDCDSGGHYVIFIICQRGIYLIMSCLSKQTKSQ